MSGHSKWATIKHKKATTDARRGKMFTKILREITVAARVGGGNPNGNPRLRSAILDARSNSVPNDNIDRAIKKGTGELAGGAYEEVVYEGYGPAGIAVLVEGTTDNKNRTTAEIRHIFTKYGGNLGDSGCVSWMFDRQGYFAIERAALDEEKFMELALELGAEDVTTEEDHYEIFTSVEDFIRVQEELERLGVPLAVKELAMVPQNTVPLAADRAGAALRLMEALEDNDDVQKVWGNFVVEEKVLAAQ